MSTTEGSTAAAAALVHRPVPSEERTALNLSEVTVGEIAKVRDAINDDAGYRAVNNDDVLRLSLLALGRLFELTEERPENATDEDDRIVLPIAQAVQGTANPHVLAHREYPDDDAGGED